MFLILNQILHSGGIKGNSVFRPTPYLNLNFRTISIAISVIISDKLISLHLHSRRITRISLIIGTILADYSNKLKIEETGN